MPRTWCKQELCENWDGEGDSCPCATFQIPIDERPVVHF